MQNIIEILKTIGITVPDEQTEQLNKLVMENYRTVADYEKVAKKRDEYKTNLDDVQRKLEGFKDVDVSQLNAQITNLTQQLDAEKSARREDAAKSVRESNVSSFLADKRFVNDITKNSIQQQLLSALAENTGETVDALYQKLITDADGRPIPNIVVDEAQAAAEANRARFTQPMNHAASGKAMTRDEIMSVRDTVQRQKLIGENKHLFMKGKTE